MSSSDEIIDFGNGQPLHAADGAQRLLENSTKELLQEQKTNGDDVVPKNNSSSSSRGPGPGPKSRPGRGSSSLIERIRQKQLKKQQRQQQQNNGLSSNGSVSSGGVGDLTPGYRAPAIAMDTNTDTARSEKESSSSYSSTPPRGLEMEKEPLAPTNPVTFPGDFTSSFPSNGGVSDDDQPTGYTSFEPLMIMSSVQDSVRSVGSNVTKMMNTVNFSQTTDDEDSDNAPLLAGGQYYDEETGGDEGYPSMKEYGTVFCKDIYGVTLGRMNRTARVILVVVIMFFIVWVLVR